MSPLEVGSWLWLSAVLVSMSVEIPSCLHVTAVVGRAGRDWTTEGISPAWILQQQMKSLTAGACSLCYRGC